jgi:hypothetical protein
MKLPASRNLAWVFFTIRSDRVNDVRGPEGSRCVGALTWRKMRPKAFGSEREHARTHVVHVVRVAMNQSLARHPASRGVCATVPTPLRRSVMLRVHCLGVAIWARRERSRHRATKGNRNADGLHKVGAPTDVDRRDLYLSDRGFGHRCDPSLDPSLVRQHSRRGRTIRAWSSAERVPGRERHRPASAARNSADYDQPSKPGVVR